MSEDLLHAIIIEQENEISELRDRIDYLERKLDDMEYDSSLAESDFRDELDDRDKIIEDLEKKLADFEDDATVLLNSLNDLWFAYAHLGK